MTYENSKIAGPKKIKRQDLPKTTHLSQPLAVTTPLFPLNSKSEKPAQIGKMYF